MGFKKRYWYLKKQLKQLKLKQILNLFFSKKQYYNEIRYHQTHPSTDA